MTDRPGKDDTAERRKDMAVQMAQMRTTLDVHTDTLTRIEAYMDDLRKTIDAIKDCPKHIDKLTKIVVGNGEAGHDEKIRSMQSWINENKESKKDNQREMRSMWFRIYGGIILASILSASAAIAAAIKVGAI